jgi:N-acetylmuramoyl-L-alanine amidase
LIQMIDLTNKLPSQGTYNRRSIDRIKYIVIHHSASDDGDPYIFNRWHMERGWPRIGYHYVIDKEGNTFRTNSIDTISYHVKNNNTKCIGICVVGNYEVDEVSDEVRAALMILIDQLRCVGEFELKGHRDFVNTLCPGSKLYHELFG